MGGFASVALGVWLSWTTGLIGESCPEAGDWRESVQRHTLVHVGPEVMSGWTVELARAGTNWTATLVERESDHAPRVFMGTTCSEVLEASALSLGLALTEAARVQSEADAPEPIVVPPPVTVTKASTPAPTPESPPPTAPPRASRFGHYGLVVMGVSLGAPRTTFAIASGYSLRAQRIAFETTLGYDTPRRIPYPEAPESGAIVQRAGLRVAICPGGSVRTVWLAGCAVGEAAAFFAHGTGIERPRLAVQPHATVGLGVRVAWAVRPGLELRIDGDGFFSAVRPAIHIGAPPPFMRMPSFGGRVLVGLAFGSPAGSTRRRTAK